MVLHCEERELAMANPLDGPIVQIQVRHLERGRSRNTLGSPNHSETMVLGGDEHLIGSNILHRMVSAPVPVRQLGGCASIGQSHQLVTETDPEGGKAGAGKLTNGIERIPDRCGIAGPIGKEEAIWL